MNDIRDLEKMRSSGLKEWELALVLIHYNRGLWFLDLLAKTRWGCPDTVVELLEEMT